MNQAAIKNDTAQSKKMMVFVLAMAVYGLATMFSELIPSFRLGIVEFSVEYFLFIPLTLAMLFDPLAVALGAATGEIVFSEVMLGQFGGLGELEKFTTIVIGVCLAGMMVKNPGDKKSVAIAAISGTGIQLLLGCLVDILKVVFAIEDFEAVAGLPESVFFTEGFAFFNDLLFSGILFCLLPTLYLVPRLYGKIEPLLGMKPRDGKVAMTAFAITPKVAAICVTGFFVALAGEFMSECDMGLIDWEAEWAESTTALVASIAVAATLAGIVIVSLIRKARDSKAVSGVK